MILADRQPNPRLELTGPSGSAAASYVPTVVSRRPHQGPQLKRKSLGGGDLLFDAEYHACPFPKPFSGGY